MNIDEPKTHIYCIPPEVKLFEENKDFLATTTGSVFVDVHANNEKGLLEPERAKRAKPGKPAIFIE